MHTFNLKKINRVKKQNGFSILEVVLAGSILTLIVFGIVSAWLYGEHALIKSGDKGRGIAIASEGIELVRNLRDVDFGALQDGTYALVNDGVNWKLWPNEEETIGVYKRIITIASEGANIRKVVATANWMNIDGTPGTYSSNTILTNWRVEKGGTKQRSATLQISNVVASPAMNSVTITWDTNKIATSRVQYGTTASYGSQTAQTDTSPMVTNHAVAFSGLSTGTTYHYRVTSIDASGRQVYSDDATFQTGADTTPPVISNVVATGYPTSALLEWDTDEAASTYVGYALNNGDPLTLTTEVDTSPRVVSHSVTVTGLTENTEYAYTVYSRDASGNLATSSGTFVTVGYGPEFSNIVVVEVSSTYVTVSWDTSLASDGQVVNIDPPNEESAIVDQDPLTTSHTVTISGLTPCTVYNSLYVRSHDSFGNLGGQAIDTVTTTGCHASVLDNRYSDIGDINAVAVADGVGSHGYSYVYLLSSNSDSIEILAVDANGSVQDHQIYDLNSSFGISGANDIFWYNNTLLVATNITAKPIAVLSLTNPAVPEFVDWYLAQYITNRAAEHIYVKSINNFLGSTRTMLVIAKAGGTEVVDTLDDIFHPSSWSALGAISLPDSKAVPADAYITNESGSGDTFLYETSDDRIYQALFSGSFDAGIPFDGNTLDTADRLPQIGGNYTTNEMLVSNNSDTKVQVFDYGDFLNFDNYTDAEKTKALSQSNFPLSYIFLNNDSQNKEFMAVNVSGHSVSAASELDMSGYFDFGLDFDASAAATIEYIPGNGKVVYTKRAQIFILNPGIE